MTLLRPFGKPLALTVVRVVDLLNGTSLLSAWLMTTLISISHSSIPSAS
jgi:hypothetical protein